jgi:hypothetical protein
MDIEPPQKLNRPKDFLVSLGIESLYIYPQLNSFSAEYTNFSAHSRPSGVRFYATLKANRGIIR